MKNKTLKLLSFGSMAVIIIAMVAATFVEKSRGTDFSFSLVYHNPAFIALWAIAAVSGLALLLKRGVKAFFTILLHCSMVIMLIGALVTHLFSQEGMISLDKGVPNSTVVTDSGRNIELPFTLTLQEFEIERYPGSMAPSDYRSLVDLDDGSQLEISMNNIGKHMGWRMYQADYSDDLQTSVLAMSKDVWGVGITYTGYLLLLVAMLCFFFQKDSQWRAALRKVTAVVALALLPLASQAAGNAQRPAAPKEVAKEIGELYVYYNDRICPLQTQARDYALKAYGKASVDGYTAEQLMTGWMFWYDEWQDRPLKIKAKEVGTSKEKEKYTVRDNAASGAAFKLFPLQVAGNVRWFGSEDRLPEMEPAEEAFIRGSISLLREEARSGNWDEVSRIVGQIKKYQEKNAEEVLPTAAKIKAERAYNAICLPKVQFMLSITLGIIMFVLSGIWLSKGRKTPAKLARALAVVSWMLFAYLTAVLALRWFASGHMPFTGSYCVMMLIAWFSTLAMSLLYRKMQLLQPLGFLLAGFTMLMATMSSANPRLTHLMPVLQSPLLSIHVLSMMISYTLLGLAMLNGILGLIVKGNEAKVSLQNLSKVIVTPAVFLLTFGTFLGAVWANISWGSYWAWDPKETWALITLLVYAFSIHGTSIKAFRNPTFYHIYMIVAFLSVLITYFGVNLILGGMHSYS
ncbi:MAG: cytochrome c biogenesis protein CcsA [Bacteroidales bacterium]|nr:cytochrome c biogenesis protein CcsA [Bacteroidales bacterium]